VAKRASNMPTRLALVPASGTVLAVSLLNGRSSFHQGVGRQHRHVQLSGIVSHQKGIDSSSEGAFAPPFGLGISAPERSTFGLNVTNEYFCPDLDTRSHAAA